MSVSYLLHVVVHSNTVLDVDVDDWRKRTKGRFLNICDADDGDVSVVLEMIPWWMMPSFDMSLSSSSLYSSSSSCYSSISVYEYSKTYATTASLFLSVSLCREVLCVTQRKSSRRGWITRMVRFGRFQNLYPWLVVNCC